MVIDYALDTYQMGLVNASLFLALTDHLAFCGSANEKWYSVSEFLYLDMSVLES